MRRGIGWTLIIGPAAIIGLQLLAVGAAVVTGGYGDGEAREALQVVGLVAANAMLPVAIGAWMVAGARRGRAPGGASALRRASTRELLGWVLTVLGLLVSVLVVVSLLAGDGLGTVVGVVPAVSLLLLPVGVWLVVSERRRVASLRRAATRSG